MDFYNQLSPFYHLLFKDWEGSLKSQADTLNEVILERWGDHTLSILDVSCGIGTQALGLAKLGYKVQASDISTGALMRARDEALQRHLSIDFSVADMRHAFDSHGTNHDILLSCDNSIPHLLNDKDILNCFKSFFDCLKPGGGCLLSVRDYEIENCSGTHVKPYGVRWENDIKYVIFQTWTFQGPIYDLDMYFISDKGGENLPTQVMRTQYYAVGLTRLKALLLEAGFDDIEIIKGRFYQPLLLATRPKI